MEPWDTPSERVHSIKKAVKCGIRKKAAGLAKKALDWKTWKTPLWDGLRDPVLRPAPDVDNDLNVEASYSMCKTPSRRRALNFIGPVISTWALVPI